MSERSYTPGPWQVHRLIDNEGKPYTTCYQAHIEIGPCMLWAPVGHVEQESNARLIAAAPEMFELLVDIENRMGEINEKAWEKLDEIINRVRGEDGR